MNLRADADDAGWLLAEESLKGLIRMQPEGVMLRLHDGDGKSVQEIPDRALKMLGEIARRA